jgi:SAM-dependent methyltransferase
MATERVDHWDGRYRTVGPDQVSWFAPEPTASLAILDALGLTPDTSVIDVGGGASFLVDRLADRGFTDLTVLDISQVALDTARARLGDTLVVWEHADLLVWEPTRQWTVWHDRAVFHFLTRDHDRATYRSLLHKAVEPGGYVVMAAFAADGPTSCSGLPVERYSPERLIESIGDGFEVVLTRRENHLTPAGATQPFTWVAFHRIEV